MHGQFKDIPRSIPWEKLDHIAYAFAVPEKNGTLTMFDENQLKKSKYIFLSCLN